MSDCSVGVGDILKADDNIADKYMDMVRNSPSELETVNCGTRVITQIDIAVEEIFINIASYAYSEGGGRALVRVEVSDEPITVSITFIDHGVPYDPLAKEDPDVTLPVNERKIGGLGIFMTKQVMDDIVYEYRDGSNVLTLKKKL